MVSKVELFAKHAFSCLMDLDAEKYFFFDFHFSLDKSKKKAYFYRQ